MAKFATEPRNGDENRGEFVERKDDVKLRSFFDSVKTRGRELLGTSHESEA